MSREAAEVRSRLGELRETANDCLRQRDEALRGWAEVAELLGCTEYDDSVVGAVRELKQRATTAEAELLRLNGPVCPHDGKRAIEHRCWSGGFLGSFIIQSFEETSPRVPHNYERCSDCDTMSHDDDAPSHCTHCFEYSSECDGMPLIGGVRPPHKPWPEGEAWLRENAR